MKLLIVLAFAALAVARPDEHYDSKYDDFDVDELINNQRLLKGYADCFLDKGNCTPEGNYFKKLMPEAIATSCSKCTEKQKPLIAKAIVAIKTKLPKEYKDIVDKHDVEGKGTAELDAFVAKYTS